MRILILLLCSAGLNAQRTTPPPAATIDYFRYVIETLAHDSMKGRLPGTVEEKKSAYFIASELKQSGSKPIRRKRFVFPFDYTGPDTTLIHSSGNVLAKVNTVSEYSIVITAHYDHIGNGKHHAGDPFDHSIHNGADDNASGIAMLLALSAWCSTHETLLQYDIIFAALSGEEDGLHGSVAFLKNKCIDTSKIICNINLDMVGHLDLNRPILVAEGALLLAAWDSVLPVDTNEFLTVQRTRVLVKGGSDHCTFLDVQIPAVMFTTGITMHYHKASDDVQTINFPGMMHIENYLESLLETLQRKKNLPELFGRK